MIAIAPNWANASVMAAFGEPLPVKNMDWPKMVASAMNRPTLARKISPQAEAGALQ